MSQTKKDKKRASILSAVVIISILAVFVGFILFPLVSEMGGMLFAVAILLLYAGGIVAVIRRLARHQNPMTADREHIHHRLIDMGLSQKQSVAIVYMLTGILGLAAVLLANSAGVKTFILFAAVCVVAIVGFAVIFGPHRRPNRKKDPEQTE